VVDIKWGRGKVSVTLTAGKWFNGKVTLSYKGDKKEREVASGGVYVVEW